MALSHAKLAKKRAKQNQKRKNKQYNPAKYRTQQVKPETKSDTLVL